MLRQLVRNFQRMLTLQAITTNTNLKHIQSVNSIAGHQQRRLIFQQTVANMDAERTTDVGSANENSAWPTTPLDSTVDSEYIVPHSAEIAGRTKTSVILDVLRTRYRITTAEEKRILTADVITSARHNSLLQTLETLCHIGVSKRSFIDYPWLITLDKLRLEKKLEALHKLRMQDINHFVAFLRLTVSRLNKIVRCLNSESASIPLGNRVYYISNKLKTDPYTVSKYLSKRLFIVEMPFDMLEGNLQHMIDYQVPPQSILKDLWAFRYTPKAVQTRFERAKIAKKDKIMPWMVRCPETILQRSLKLSIDELEVLGNRSSVIEYIADRLEFTVEETKGIMAKHPAVYHVRVTKVKEVLDYLLDQEEFTRYDIAQVPRILCHGLDTTKKRLEELKSYGCRPSSLVIVCRSKREYAKFVQYWLGMQRTFQKPIENTITTGNDTTKEQQNSSKADT